jgi:hypothetical protein
MLPLRLYYLHGRRSKSRLRVRLHRKQLVYPTSIMLLLPGSASDKTGRGRREETLMHLSMLL